MSAQVLKGIEVAKAINEDISEKVKKLDGYIPHLAIIRVGEKSDDIAYEKGAVKKMEKLGLEYTVYKFPEDITDERFQMEFDRIPYIFRFGRKRVKVMVPVLIVLVAAMCVFWSIFYSTKESTYIKPALEGYEPVCINSYDYKYLIITIIAAVLVVLVSLWMVLSTVYEKKAFAKASDTSARLRIDQQEKVREELQNWKLHRTDY